MSLPTVTIESDYRDLDAYLMTVFQQLEGIADVPDAQQTLHNFLTSPAGRKLNQNLENFLFEMFFAKCRKYFTTDSSS